MLTLNVPGTDAALQHAVNTRPKALKEWLERLPFANAAETAQQLVLALYSLNRHPLGGDDRYALLALYRPAIARAVLSLEAQLAESGVPPHALQRQSGALLRELHIEHSIGYKQVLLALAAPRFGRTAPKRMAEVTARLLAALRDVHTGCALIHAPTPDGLWQEMHQIHAFAQVSNLADVTVDDAVPASLAYTQALLIALADPPHMSYAELVHTRLYLDHFAARSMLSAAPVAGHHGFAIRTDGDVPPSAFATGPAAAALWLDTDALCRHLQDTAVRLRAGESPRRIGLPTGMESEPSLALCKRLLKQWSNGAQRVFKRYATAGSTVEMVAGVSAIHRLLEQRPQPALAASAVAAPVTVNATQWTVSNDSASGLALTGAPDAPLNLKAGDPLALRDDAELGWSLGVIRWVRMRDARQVELGVERLSPQIQPVWVRLLRGPRKAGPEPALFIPGLAALKQNDRLMLPRNLYQIGMDAEVLHAPHQYILTFGRRLAHSPSFDLIDFTLLPDEQP